MSGIILQCWNSYYFGSRLSDRQLFHIWNNSPHAKLFPILLWQSLEEKRYGIFCPYICFFSGRSERFSLGSFLQGSKGSVWVSPGKMNSVLSDIAYHPWLSPVFPSLLSHLPSYLIILFTSLLHCHFWFTNKIYTMSLFHVLPLVPFSIPNLFGSTDCMLLLI